MLRSDHRLTQIEKLFYQTSLFMISNNIRLSSGSYSVDVIDRKFPYTMYTYSVIIIFKLGLFVFGHVNLCGAATEVNIL